MGVVVHSIKNVLNQYNYITLSNTQQRILQRILGLRECINTTMSVIGLTQIIKKKHENTKNLLLFLDIEIIYNI